MARESEYECDEAEDMEELCRQRMSEVVKDGGWLRMGNKDGYDAGIA